jgi:hypothetical protein
MIVTEEYLLNKGFEKEEFSIGWTKFRKEPLEIVQIPLKNGGFIFGFEYQFMEQPRYKYSITIEEVGQLYKILTKKEL